MEPEWYTLQIGSLISYVKSHADKAIDLGGTDALGNPCHGYVLMLVAPENRNADETREFGDYESIPVTGWEALHVQASTNTEALIAYPDAHASRFVRTPHSTPPVLSGAIRLQDRRILSLSGFSEYLNEAIVSSAAQAWNFHAVGRDRVDALRNGQGSDKIRELQNWIGDPYLSEA